ncbi:LOW QUALITY PROTEIN: cytochrome P450 4F4-like [Prinia subflava]|uniref:LOW QUALITY PROTEIN: cytochrome P450 4F4-like n=1 Tax=Prinia subflava TaxID=208062 RepID=UPI002FE0965B
MNRFLEQREALQKQVGVLTLPKLQCKELDTSISSTLGLIRSLQEAVQQKDAAQATREEQLLQELQESRAGERRCRDAVQLLQAEVSQLRLRLRSSEDRAEALATQHQQASGAHRTAQCQLDRLLLAVHRMARDDPAELTVDTVEAALQDLWQHLEHSQKDLNDARKKIQALKLQLSTTQAQRDYLCACNQELQKQLAERQEAIERAERKNSLETALREEATARKEEAMTLHQEVACLQSKLESMEKERKDVLGQSTEQGLQQVDTLVARYCHGCLWWGLPWLPVLLLFHPSTLRPLLRASAFVAPKDKIFYGFLKPWLGEGLLLSGGQRWARHRRLLTPAFHGDVLRNYLGIFNQSTRVLLAKCEAAAAAAGGGPVELEVLQPLSLLTLDTLQKCILSHESHCQERPSEYLQAILELSSLVVRHQLRPLLHPWWLYSLSSDGRRFGHACATVHAFTADVVQRRHRALASLGHQAWLDGHLGHSMDFIDLLLLTKDENGHTLSDEDIAAEADTFMFEGHDTTASGLAWLFYNLASHPEHQERCRQEVQQLLAGRDTADIEWEDLSQLPFTTMCIKESLRLHPPVTAVSRRCTKDIPLCDGCVNPKGVICLMSIYGTHHNPDLWPKPKVGARVQPLRFSPENSKGQSPSSFIPFSAEPRNCIGQSFAMAEMKVVVALTLARFVLPRDAARPPPRRKPELILRAEDGIWLLLEPLVGLA